MAANCEQTLARQTIINVQISTHLKLGETCEEAAKKLAGSVGKSKRLKTKGKYMTCKQHRGRVETEDFNTKVKKIKEAARKALLEAAADAKAAAAKAKADADAKAEKAKLDAAAEKDRLAKREAEKVKHEVKAKAGEKAASLVVESVSEEEPEVRETHTTKDIIDTFVDIKSLSRSDANCRRVIAALDNDQNIPLNIAWEALGEGTSYAVACSDPPVGRLISGRHDETLFDLARFKENHHGKIFDEVIRQVTRKCCEGIPQCYPMPHCVEKLLNDDQEFRKALGCGAWDSEECDTIQNIVEKDYERLKDVKEYFKKSYEPVKTEYALKMR